MASTGFMASLKSHLFLVAVAGGVLGSFTIFGYAQEALTRGEYGGERFTFPTFLIVISAFSNLVVSSFILLVTGDKKWSAGAPVKDWLIVSSAYLGAHFCGLTALQYIPFPLQVVCKSCKAVPVMFGEMIFAKKEHSIEKKLQVLLMTVGVVIFTLAGGQKKGKDADDWAITPTLFFGLGLVVCALGCDGIYGPYQNAIEKTYESCTAYHLMFNMNFYELLMASAIAGVGGELTDGLAFVAKHPDIMPNLLYFGATMSIGSLFIYTLQKNFGALTVTLTTTLRKLISVVFSVLWFGHSLTIAQWVATFTVFLCQPIAKQIVKILDWAAAKRSTVTERSEDVIQVQVMDKASLV